MDPFQAELREFIRRLNVQDDRINEATRQAYALAQGIRDLYEDGTGGPKYCITTITGYVNGGDIVTPIPGASLQVTGHASGINYGTFVLPAGTFALDLILDDSDASLDFVATGPGVRFQAGVTNNRSVLTPCGSNALTSIGTQPATGYQFSNQCAFPIANTLNWTDAVLGTGTMTGTLNWATGCQAGTSFAHGSCPSVAGIWGLTMGATGLGINWFSRSDATPCVLATTCASGLAGLVPYGQTNTFVSKTCPDASTKFEINFTVAEPAFHGAGTHTLRIYEP